jgi:hypothetical protein
MSVFELVWPVETTKINNAESTNVGLSKGNYFALKL